jgi:hypothetical protein
MDDSLLRKVSSVLRIDFPIYENGCVLVIVDLSGIFMH